MKSIILTLNVISLWFVSLWTFYGVLELDVLWWWVFFMSFSSIYAAFFTRKLLHQKSALASLNLYFTNLVKHALFWSVIFIILVSCGIYLIKNSPEFDPLNIEYRLAVDVSKIALIAGFALIYFSLILVGSIGLGVTKLVKIKADGV